MEINTPEDDYILSKIHLIRCRKVMLDEDLAILYNVPTKRINEQVKRSLERFPVDFMFELTQEEVENLRSQFATANSKMKRYLPKAFTEHGILMLSSVLNSDIAIKVNIQIIRLFIKMREILSTHKDVLLKLEQMEKRMDTTDEDIQLIFSYLKQLINTPNPPRQRIGFLAGDKPE